MWGEEEERIKAAQISVMSHTVSGSTCPWPVDVGEGTGLGQEANVWVELDCEDLGGVIQ